MGLPARESRRLPSFEGPERDERVDDAYPANGVGQRHLHRLVGTGTQSDQHDIGRIVWRHRVGRIDHVIDGFGSTDEMRLLARSHPAIAVPTQIEAQHAQSGLCPRTGQIDPHPRLADVGRVALVDEHDGGAVGRTGRLGHDAEEAVRSDGDLALDDLGSGRGPRHNGRSAIRRSHGHVGTCHGLVDPGRHHIDRLVRRALHGRIEQLTLSDGGDPLDVKAVETTNEAARTEPLGVFEHEEPIGQRPLQPGQVESREVAGRHGVETNTRRLDGPIMILAAQAHHPIGPLLAKERLS